MYARLTASGGWSGTRHPPTPTPTPEAPFCGSSGLFRDSATLPGVTLAVPLLLIIVGLALIAGRKSPPVATAVIFLIIGFYMGGTDTGKQVVAGLNDLARLIG